MRAIFAACLALSVCIAAPCRSQSLEVAPVSITLEPEQRTASLTVTNRSTKPVTIQVRPFQWRETDGVASLTETSALAASPPFAEIGPGQQQSIRLLLREAPGAAEATYRLLVDQLPAPNAVGVRVALRLSLPVFAQPSVPAAAALEWQIVQSRSGADLQVHNRGNRHATIVGVQLGPANASAIPVRTANHPYILPGAMARWPVGGARLGSGPVRLTVTSDAGIVVATAPIVSAPP